MACALLAATAAMSAAAAAGVPTGAASFEHILVIIAENKSYDLIVGPQSAAPTINRLAREYGLATQFFAEVHPSEGNYVAMLAGDTFGIHDDDAFYCRPGMHDHWCPKSSEPDYVNHTLSARSLMDQLESRGLSWKGYMESLPVAGSLAIRYPTAEAPVPGSPTQLYAAKHDGFLNFERVQQDPARTSKIVDFAVLYQDLDAGRVPSYAHIVPNQCNDMHGRDPAPEVPQDCRKGEMRALIGRGDRVIGQLVDRIMRSPIWLADGNTAIVITFDENDKDERVGPDQGCCDTESSSAANSGGGHIPTIVITNHGPRAVIDATPYNHYSLLRTTERLFGIPEYLGHAADERAGVRVMSALFGSPR
jgi:phosphatidylinositol-3-phosphatase